MEKVWTVVRFTAEDTVEAVPFTWSLITDVTGHLFPRTRSRQQFENTNNPGHAGLPLKLFLFETASMVRNN